MAKTWYPVIDYAACSECGICVEDCPHGVYDKDKAPTPVVKKNVHHVHTWMSNENTVYFEAHIEMENIRICEASEIYEEIEHMLKEHYGISHVTLQAESDVCTDKALFKC